MWVASKEQVTHVSADGKVLKNPTSIGSKKKKGELRAVALYVDVIAPEIAFTAPQEGSLMREGAPALMGSFPVKLVTAPGIDPWTVMLMVSESVRAPSLTLKVKVVIPT